MRLTVQSTTTRTGPSTRPLAQRYASGIVGAFVISLALVGCGRSAPESAAEIVPSEGEPEAAGVQVVGEQQVVVPPPTTITIPTTVVTTVAPAVGATSYEIQPGDTLSVIAEQFGITTDALSQANGITDVNSIRPGQELVIPAPG